MHQIECNAYCIFSVLSGERDAFLNFFKFLDGLQYQNSIKVLITGIIISSNDSIHGNIFSCWSFLFSWFLFNSSGKWTKML